MRHLIPLTPLFSLCVSTCVAAQTPALQLAERFQDHPDIEISAYGISEKFDGVRAYWDGQQFISRQGLRLTLPKTLLEQLPPIPLDGELWLGYERFSELTGLLNSHDDQDPRWQQLRYLVFDLPQHGGSFARRHHALKQLIANQPNVFLTSIEQQRFDNADALEQFLEQVVTRQGEGVMLHRWSSVYQAGRNSALLKYKRFQDAEAKVLGYIDGQGKYEGKVGALIVQLESGETLRIGSGLTDQLRREPPPINAIISFRFEGFTAKGKPRFARFLRERVEL